MAKKNLVTEAAPSLFLRFYLLLVALGLCTRIFCKQRAEYDTVLPLYSYELCGSNIFINDHVDGLFVSTTNIRGDGNIYGAAWRERERAEILFYLVSQA